VENLKKYFKILLFAGALLFLFQSSVTPFIHNHPHDLRVHYDCPAYILKTSLISFFFLMILSIKLKIPFLMNLQTAENRRSTSLVDLLGFQNKAPPAR